MIDATDGKTKSDHVMGHSHFRVIGRSAKMVAVTDRHKSTGSGETFIDRRLHSAHGNPLSHAIVPVYDGCGCRLTNNADVRTRIDNTGTQPFDVDGKADDTMGCDTP